MQSDNSENLDAIRHSFAHLLAMAVQGHDPGAKLAIGPAIDDGFYYDIEFSEGRAPSPEDLPKLEKYMRELVKKNLAFERMEVSAEEAKKTFRNAPYKLELIDEILEKGEQISLYKTGDFVDLCRGVHVKNTNEIDPRAFTLSHIAGAYWRGDEKNTMLTRIYGLAFSSKEELDKHLEMLEEAKKRDHRKIGKELDLFVYSELVGAGLPLFTPKGTVLRDEINAYSQELRIKRGFQKVWIPHITKTELYKVSGHWDKFGDELFLVKSQETTDEFALKPMNCPHHQQIYMSRPRSYRDLPIRYLETTTVYRDEKKGELAGISRVRSITQDDSHIFSTLEQVETEYQSIMEMVVEFYKTMGMDFKARLSFRDLQEPEKYLGESEQWDRGESMLETIAKNSSSEYFVAPGEAAFYGPKIDFIATDALGREHQLATAQLDFVQPKRFGLEYIDSDGVTKTPVMTHLAIAGSFERFLSVYIEHVAGAFPLWLSPVQVKILPISEKHSDFATEMFEVLKAAGIRVELDDSNETLGKKIRNGKRTKVPYMLIMGDKEVESKTATVESRDRGNEGTADVTTLLSKFQSEIEERK